eukprot:Pgem_evm1s11551
MRWVKQEGGGENNNDKKCKLPVYLNTTRQQLLFSFSVEAPKNYPSTTLYQRGVALKFQRKNLKLTYIEYIYRIPELFTVTKL